MSSYSHISLAQEISLRLWFPSSAWHPRTLIPGFFPLPFTTGKLWPTPVPSLGSLTLHPNPELTGVMRWVCGITGFCEDLNKSHALSHLAEEVKQWTNPLLQSRNVLFREGLQAFPKSPENHVYSSSVKSLYTIICLSSLGWKRNYIQ